MEIVFKLPSYIVLLSFQMIFATISEEKQPIEVVSPIYIYFPGVGVANKKL